VVPGLSMPADVVGAGIAGAVILALVSASLPAIFAARLPIAEALGRH
jgi:ABC-type antimicrobial peptide transport system permease subunit